MNIIISGGSGLIGQHLMRYYFSKYKVKVLTTNSDLVSEKYSYWNPDEEILDQDIIDEADVIINLAGAPVAKRWTTSYKRLIMSSRENATKLLVNACNQSKKLKHFISSSAIGYYGSSPYLRKEDSSPSYDFLGSVCSKWENEVYKLKDEHSYNIIRIGLVLSRDGGALQEMLKQFKKGLGSVLGNGKQMVSWIHIDDLCQMIIFLMNLRINKEIYNGVSPIPVNNEELTKKIAKIFKLLNIMPAVPSFVLNLMLGDMSMLLLDSSFISSKKIEDAGFYFKYPELGPALRSLL